MTKYYLGLVLLLLAWTYYQHEFNNRLIANALQNKPSKQADRQKTISHGEMHLGRPNQKFIIAYVGGFKGLLQVDSIQVQKLTHINYAFADVKDSRVFLRKESTDTINLRLLLGLKKRNPGIKIILSVGGWLWSGRFSDAALSDSSRISFARSASAVLQRFNLDGIDIDWEYPGQPGAGNPFRAEDKENFTAMLRQLRISLDSTGRVLGRHLMLSIAAAADHNYLEHIQARAISRYLDYFNLMTYDYKDEGDSSTGHHTNLYAGVGSEAMSADKTVSLFLQDSVPASKLLMGIAFYGRGYKIKGLENAGLYQAARGNARAGSYDYIRDSLLSRPDYTRLWDREAHAPYLFDAKDSIFITYEDEQSVREKCRYVNKRQLAGVMFWEYFDDPKNYLLNEINSQLGKPKLTIK